MKEAIMELVNRQFVEKELAALGELQEGECSAVEVYSEALQRVKDTELIPTLQECRNSHAKRVQKLRDMLIERGALPRENTGLMGGLARFVEGGASMLNDTAAIAVLATGEEFGLRQYEQLMPALASDMWDKAEQELLPGQRKTQRTISLLSTLLRNQRGS